MIALLLGNFILMAVDARQQDSKQRLIRVWLQAAADGVQSPVTTLSNAVTGYFQKISNLRDASTENDQLKQRVQELELKVQSTETLASENERLKSLLKLQEEKKTSIIPAKIIGRDPSSWFNYAIINRGSLAGVELNMPVVTNEGLAGRIVAVSPLTSQFMLLSDDKSGVASIVGQIGQSNALGVVKGLKDRDLLEMTYVPGGIQVQVGDPVYTTGLDGNFPPDLKIGEVVDIRAASATDTQKIYIQPSANINGLREVAVFLYKPNGKQQWDRALPNVAKDVPGVMPQPDNNNGTAANTANPSGNPYFRPAPSSSSSAPKPAANTNTTPR